MLIVLLENGKISTTSNREKDLPTYYLEHSNLEYIAYKNDLELISKFNEQLGNCYLVSLGFDAGNGVFKTLTYESKSASLNCLSDFSNKRHLVFLETLRSSQC